MPEKPEVVTVARTLTRSLLGKTFSKTEVYWDNIISYPDPDTFSKQLTGQTIEEITTRGKWIVFFLTKDALLVHLRMEGRFFFREPETPRGPHEHVSFRFTDESEMRYVDTRKFGKMVLLPKERVHLERPLSLLGYEYDDDALSERYLKEAFAKKTLPIKTVLLDQTIIAGIGNIYDDEILFLSRIHPLTRARDLTQKDREEILLHTKEVLEKAIACGGTTIRTYESEEGVHGRFQNELAIHGKTVCPVCQGPVTKEMVHGRGTYYCPRCQKKRPGRQAKCKQRGLESENNPSRTQR